MYEREFRVQYDVVAPSGLDYLVEDELLSFRAGSGDEAREIAQARIAAKYPGLEIQNIRYIGRHWWRRRFIVRYDVLAPSGLEYLAEWEPMPVDAETEQEVLDIAMPRIAATYPGRQICNVQCFEER